MRRPPVTLALLLALLAPPPAFAEQKAALCMPMFDPYPDRAAASKASTGGEFEVLRNDREEPVLAFYGTGRQFADSILDQIGADLTRAPSHLGTLTQESPDSRGGAISTYTAPLYRASERSWPDLEDLAEFEKGPAVFHGLPASREITLEIGGRSASVKWSKADQGSLSYVIEDSLGGKVTYRAVHTFGPKWVQDEHGFVLGVSYDEIGRAVRVFIGLDYILETDFYSSSEESQWHWTERRLTDSAGKVLHRWAWSSNPREPRPGARLFADGMGRAMGTGPVLAEWDQELYPEGLAVLPAHHISLLAPIGGNGPAWRSVALPSQGTRAIAPRPYTLGRLDFTEAEFRLWIDLGHQKGTKGRLATLGASGVVTLPRLEPTPDRIEAFRKRGEF